jgi:hypothetical protein
MAGLYGIYRQNFKFLRKFTAVHVGVGYKIYKNGLKLALMINAALLNAFLGFDEQF